MNFTTIDRIFSNISRDLKEESLNEGDIIEYAGQALEFLKSPRLKEEAVAFLEINNFEAELPFGLLNIIQVARNNRYTKKDKCSCVKEVEEYIKDNDIDTYKCEQSLCEENICYKPFFDMNLQYINWVSESNHYYKQNYTPVKLANSAFFKTIVCKENKIDYNGCDDQYTIVGTINRKIRVSFQEGMIAIAYLKTPTDLETGYPLIPDDISVITAVEYYIKWKMAESLSWQVRQGYTQLAQYYRQLWDKYVGQAKAYSMMPEGIDDLQDLMEQSYYLIPDFNRYDNYFGMNPSFNRGYLKN